MSAFDDQYLLRAVKKCITEHGGDGSDIGENVHAMRELEHEIDGLVVGAAEEAQEQAAEAESRAEDAESELIKAQQRIEHLESTIKDMQAAAQKAG